jgi:hypothetical protein
MPLTGTDFTPPIAPTGWPRRLNVEDRLIPTRDTGSLEVIEPRKILRLGVKKGLANAKSG